MAERKEHTEPFKKAVEKCKKENPELEEGKCFAMITSTFNKASKPIFVGQEAMGEIVMLQVSFGSHLQELNEEAKKPCDDCPDTAYTELSEQEIIAHRKSLTPASNKETA